MKKLKVAAYARVSTDKDDQANSLENQKQYFQSYILNHEDWDFVDVYFDEGISGTQTKKRLGFNKMIDDAENGDIDLIITKEVSRFARNTVDTLSYTRRLKDSGIGVIFTLDNIDTRQSDGEFRLTIMASIAQEESRKTSERVKWGQKRQMEKGVVFGRDLLGYTVKNGVLYINEEEVPVVRAIFHKYTNEGKGSHTIARELLEEGMKPKRISLWSNTIILKVLRNEKYVGDLLQKKTYTPNYLTHSKKYNHGQEEMIYLKDHHEAIIDRDLWNRTQEELRRRSPSAQQKAKHSNRYWCSGKIYCAECGSLFVGRTKRWKDGKQYKSWKCNASVNYMRAKQDEYGNPIKCHNNSINQKTLNFCMNYCISLMQTEQDSLKKEIITEISKVKEQSSYESKTKHIEEKIKQVETKKRRLIDLALDNVISGQDLKTQTAWYNEEIESLQLQLNESLSEDKKHQAQIRDMESYVNELDKIMSINSADSELVYKEIVKHIDVHNDKILDVWLKPLPFGIQLKVKTTGRRDNYMTEILEYSYINPESKGNI